MGLVDNTWCDHLPLSIQSVWKFRRFSEAFDIQLHTRCVSICFVGNWIENLTSLETLDVYDPQIWCQLSTTRLTNLRTLILVDTKLEGNFERFYDSFQNLTSLQVLFLACPGDIFVSEIFKRCPTITHFAVCGGDIYDDGKWNEFAVNLQVLEMLEIKNLTPSIERLPKLQALRIFVLTGAEDLTCSEGGFPQLRALHLLLVRARFIVKEGGLPLLTHLQLNKPENFIAPERLKQLINNNAS